MKEIVEQVKKIADIVYNRWVSKKLFVLLIATFLLWYTKISEDVWEMIAIVYLGVQATVDTATTWKHGSVTNKKGKVEPVPPVNEKGP